MERLEPFKGWFAHGGNTIASVIVTVMLFQFDFIQINHSKLETAYTRITHLENMLAEQTANYIVLTAELSDMRVRFEDKFDAKGYLQQYLDAIDSPSWVKYWDPDTEHFRMLMINNAYVIEYGVSKAKYENATDFEIYPHQQAERYRKHDMAVLREKKFIRVVEPVLPDGRKLEHTEIWKFYFKLPDGRDAIGALQIQTGNGAKTAKKSLVSYPPT